MAMIDWCLRQTCTIRPYACTVDGEDQYGPPETRKCRIQHGAYLRQTYRNANTPVDQVEARARMMCRGERIPSRSLIECDGESYIALECCDARGLNRTDHLEVYLY